MPEERRTMFSGTLPFLRNASKEDNGSGERKKTQNGPLAGPPFRSAPLLDISDTGYCLRFCLKDEVHRKQKSWTD